MVVLAAEGKELNSWNAKNVECVRKQRLRLILCLSVSYSLLRVLI